MGFNSGFKGLNRLYVKVYVFKSIGSSPAR